MEKQHIRLHDGSGRRRHSDLVIRHTQQDFWELIPAGKTNCYYVRNTATGRYIGSCNMQPSSRSKVRMSDTPVEYYIKQIIIDFRRQQRLLVDVVDRLLWI